MVTTTVFIKESLLLLCLIIKYYNYYALAYFVVEHHSGVFIFLLETHHLLRGGSVQRLRHPGVHSGHHQHRTPFNCILGLVRGAFQYKSGLLLKVSDKPLVFSDIIKYLQS